MEYQRGGEVSEKNKLDLAVPVYAGDENISPTSAVNSLTICVNFKYPHQ